MKQKHVIIISLFFLGLIILGTSVILQNSNRNQQNKDINLENNNNSPAKNKAGSPTSEVIDKTANWNKACHLDVCLKYPHIEGYGAFSVVPPEEMQTTTIYDESSNSYKEIIGTERFTISQEHPGDRFDISRKKEKPGDFDSLDTTIINGVNFKKYPAKDRQSAKDSGPDISACGYITKYNEYYYTFDSSLCHKKSDTFELMMESVQFE